MNQKMWDSTYSTDEYVYGKLPNEFLSQHAESLPKGRILLIGEGEGRNAVFLAAKGYSVTAVDISTVGLEKAQQLAHESGVSIETECADLDTYDLGEHCWDGIVSIFCHLPSIVRKTLHQRVQTALKPSGVFMIEGYTPEQLNFKTGGPPKIDMMLSKEILTSELFGLNFIHLAELEREVIEGKKHFGMAAVVQGIATA